jgi:hypothetical protein
MPKGPFTINIDKLNEKDCMMYQYKLNSYAHSCGCMEGGIFALTALMIIIAYISFKILNGLWSELSDFSM